MEIAQESLTKHKGSSMLQTMNKTEIRMRVLIGYSRDVVTLNIMRAKGIEAYTCDLLPADHEFHLQGDVWSYLGQDWDFAILHPMCKYLTCSAAWAFTDGPYHQKVKPDTLVGEPRRVARDAEIENFKRLLALPYPKAIENPARSFLSKAIRKPDQTIQPYNFGDDASKLTGFWKDSCVPDLVNTVRKDGRIVEWCGKKVERWSNQTDSGQNKLTPSEDRWLDRSKTYKGVAEAMGEQWGNWLMLNPRQNKGQ